MKKKDLKGFVTGLIVATLVFSMCVPAIAKSGKIQKELTYNNISVTLDGQKLDLKDAKGNSVEPFRMDGTNYLPVRALAEALGLNVAWDSATQTVKLTTGNSTTPSVPPSSEKVSHTEYLTESGKMVIIFQNDGSTPIPDFDAEITFLDADGKMMAVKSDGHDAVLPGAQVVSIIDLPRDSNFSIVAYDSYEISIKVNSQAKLYENLKESLKIEDNKGVNGAIAKVTNNSAKTIDELEMVAVYYKGDKVVGASEVEERDIASGESVTLEFSVPYDKNYRSISFDSYKIFVNQAHNFGF